MPPDVENWDEDVDFQGDLFGNSLSTQPTSLSSRVSIRSESNAADEDWQVLITPNDDSSISKAISSAKQVGIPIPQSVPQSALLGGTIKRLGKKKSRINLADDWGDDFDLAGGDGGLKLKVGAKKEPPTTPANNNDDDFDTEWAEGSLGIRFGGTRRDMRGRSSSVSAMSPSMGSCMTLESEDDDLGGLVLPSEPIDFSAKLKLRQERDREVEERKEAPTSAPVMVERRDSQTSRISQLSRRTAADDDDDLFSGLDFDGRDIVEHSRKRKINSNIKIETTKSHPSPARANATTVTFTDKPVTSRIPRPTNATSKASKLDPVYETGAPRAPAPPQPQLSRINRPTPTTTSAQLLRSKRSAPALGRPPVPFLPAGISTAQSHHVTAKGSMHFRQPSAEHHDSRPISPPVRSFSRMSVIDPVRGTPSRSGGRKEGFAPAALARVAANQRTLHVQKKRVYGHGNELDSFDDLPTSATKEQMFMKEPTKRGPPKTLRRKDSRANLNLAMLERPETATPATSSTHPSTPLPPPTPSSRGFFPAANVAHATHDATVNAAPKVENTPRFARDTAASRIAREQRLGTAPTTRLRGEGPLMPMNVNWKAQVAARSPHNSPTSKRKNKDGKRPMLIKNMTPGNIKSKSLPFK
jgi:hypothetical protein